MHSHAAAEPVARPDGPAASVMLDVGPGRGALVIRCDEDRLGGEIEIEPAPSGAVPEGGRRVHTGIHRRRTGMGSIVVAVFGSLPAGDWQVLDHRGGAPAAVRVPDAAVAEVDLRAAALAGAG